LDLLRGYGPSSRSGIPATASRRTSLRIHRSPHPSSFVIVPNELAQNRAMSYTARGLLVDLLSRPDDWRETCRQMADSSPQGRKALESALDELRAWGYYRVEVVRLSNGRIRSEAHIFDRPQRGARPGATIPASGVAAPGDPDVLSKYLVKVPSLPESTAAQADGDETAETTAPEGRREGTAPVSGSTASAAAAETAEPEEPDRATAEAMLMLLRVVRAERRLPLGAAEAAALAPLVRSWMDRGSSEDQLREALLAGLPHVVHSPAAVVRSRLERKMPGQRVEQQSKRGAECAECRDPLPQPGLCSRCRGTRGSSSRDRAQGEVTERGMAKVRAVMAMAGK
jgi:hypothetical protein